MTEVSVEKRGRVTIVSIDRESVRNAVDGKTARALADAFRAFDEDEGADVAVLQGKYGTFCAGADLKAVASQSDSNRLQPEGDGPMGPSRMLLSKPVIAAVNGAVAGAGMSIILSCDMRFFAQSGFVVSSFSKRGLTAELGIAWMLEKMVGADAALDILWSSRKVQAEEAKELKLATRVYADEDLVGEALGYIELLADDCSPASIAAMKGQIYRDIFRDPTESFKEAHRMQKEALKTADFVEGINAFMEKRKPVFQGR